MKKLQVIGLALVAVFAFFAVAAASASAAEWLADGASIAAGTTVNTDTTGSVVLEDMLSKVAIECKGSGTGTIGSGAADVTSTIVEEGCVKAPGSAECKNPKAAAIHLPWTTKLTSLEEDEISNSGAGEPGYEVLCEGLPTVTCKSSAAENAKVLVHNIAGEKVEIEFMGLDKSKCSDFGEGLVVSGKETVTGLDADGVTVLGISVS